MHKVNIAANVAEMDGSDEDMSIVQDDCDRSITSNPETTAPSDPTPPLKQTVGCING